MVLDVQTHGKLHFGPKAYMVLDVQTHMVSYTLVLSHTWSLMYRHI